MGTNWAVKDEVIEQLKKGVPSVVLEKKYGIPQSTIGTWLGKLNKIEKVPTQKTETISLKNNAELINTAEARIVSIITGIVADDVSDDEWFEVQEKISKELKELALAVDLPTKPL